MASPLIFDIETQQLFQEVAGRKEKLKVSVVGVYSYQTDSYTHFSEKELPGLFTMFENASHIIGFNINYFDLVVLKPYYIGNLQKFSRLDLMDEIQINAGRRIALDDLTQATLNKRKEGHGIMAVDYYRSGNFKKLIEYCLADVRLTKELYEYGQKHGKVFYQGSNGKIGIPVNWKLESNLGKDISLTLPI